MIWFSIHGRWQRVYDFRAAGSNFHSLGIVFFFSILILQIFTYITTLEETFFPWWTIKVGRASAFPPSPPFLSPQRPHSLPNILDWEDEKITHRIHLFFLPCGVTMEILFRWEKSETEWISGPSRAIFFHDMKLWCNLRFDRMLTVHFWVQRGHSLVYDILPPFFGFCFCFFGVIIPFELCI